MDGLGQAAQARSQHAVNREVLVDVLLEQASSSPFASDLAKQNIGLLRETNVFTITTGHQLCIYGGPMFFFYKIISTIKWCRAAEEKGIKAVPVYWMASEDHDFEEINHIYVKGKRLTWNTPGGGAVGDLELKQADAFASELRELLASDHHALEELKELECIFKTDRNLSDAIRDFVYRVFADYGVVVIDAADTRLKKLFAPVIERELASSFSEIAVNASTQKLNELGFSGQVTPREVNLFWIEPGVRERIVREDEGFSLANGSKSFKADEFAEILQQSPDHFSPNVILRPVYQEVILPNLAYIGGPGELSYWLQLKSMFDEADVFYPMLILRDMAVVVDERAQKKSHQLKVSYEDLRNDRETLIKRLLRAHGTHENLVQEAARDIDGLMNDLKVALERVEPTLLRSSESEQVRFQKRMEALRKKVLRAEKRKNETLIQRLDALYEMLFPNGSPQERVVNYLELSPVFTDVIEALLKTPIEPFDETKVLLITETISTTTD